MRITDPIYVAIYASTVSNLVLKKLNEGFPEISKEEMNLIMESAESIADFEIELRLGLIRRDM